MATAKTRAHIMTSSTPAMATDLESDPFGERSAPLIHTRLQALGARILFESNDRRLLRLVDSAFGRLPGHRLSPTVPELRVRLLLSTRQPKPRRLEPSPLALLNAGGLFGGATDSSNFVILSPRERTALIVVSPSMLRNPYHIRYELIEFAVFTLAARVQRLVSLHAACVGLAGRGILLMGPSGAGKSTVSLHCLLDGFEFLSEDSVFVAPRGMRATGVANFLHTRADSLSWLGRSREAASIRKSPVIRRRSGIKKFEIDLRREPFKLAKRPLEIVSIVFLSSKSAGTRPLLDPLSRVELHRRLSVMQAYGATQPQWRTFSGSASRIGAFELRRGRHPMNSVEALRSLLVGHRIHDRHSR
jgi:hypothetical protein